MNLETALSENYNKVRAAEIADFSAASQQNFDKLVAIFREGNYRITQRAAQPLSEAALARPELMRKHFSFFLDLLKNEDTPVALRRNVLRILSTSDLPEKTHGQLLATCFGMVENFQNAVAIKAYALILLEKLAAFYPEIIPELQLLVSERALQETAAFQARAKRIMKLTTTT